MGKYDRQHLAGFLIVLLMSLIMGAMVVFRAMTASIPSAPPSPQEYTTEDSPLIAIATKIARWRVLLEEWKGLEQQLLPLYAQLQEAELLLADGRKAPSLEEIDSIKALVGEIEKINRRISEISKETTRLQVECEEIILQIQQMIEMEHLPAGFESSNQA